MESPQQEVVWEGALETGDYAADTVEITAGESGNYSLLVEGNNAGGNFNLSWE